MNNQISDLDGNWRVTCLGIARPVNISGNCKRINNGTGHNIVLGIKWGYFSIKEEEDYLVLDYDDPRNNPLVRRIRDRMYREGEGWRGLFYLNERRFFDFRLDR